MTHIPQELETVSAHAGHSEGIKVKKGHFLSQKPCCCGKLNKQLLCRKCLKV